jgi:hypothetical protein
MASRTCLLLSRPIEDQVHLRTINVAKGRIIRNLSIPDLHVIQQRPGL